MGLRQGRDPRRRCFASCALLARNQRRLHTPAGGQVPLGGGTWGWACQALFPQIPSTFFSRRPKARSVERLTPAYIVYARFGSKDGMIPSGNTGRLPDTMSVSCLPNDGSDPARAAPSRPRTCLHSKNLLFPMEGRRLGASSAPSLAVSLP